MKVLRYSKAVELKSSKELSFSTVLEYLISPKELFTDFIEISSAWFRLKWIKKVSLLVTASLYIDQSPQKFQVFEWPQ
jgi:hypothetical protein